MDAKEAHKKWEEAADLREDKAYVRSKLRDENESSLQTCMLNVLQGIACARKNKVLPHQLIKQAQAALLDLAQATEELSWLGAILERDTMNLKERMERLERLFESEEPSHRASERRDGASHARGKADKKRT